MVDEKTLNDGIMDNIELSLPINPAYVTAARQTASSIASRLGFDADEVEDVMAAVSEACAFVIKKLAGSGTGSFKLVFIPRQELLEITLSCHSRAFLDSPDGDYSLLLIKGLMERFEIAHDKVMNAVELRMAKRHKDGFFIE